MNKNEKKGGLSRLYCGESVAIELFVSLDKPLYLPSLHFYFTSVNEPMIDVLKELLIARQRHDCEIINVILLGDVFPSKMRQQICMSTKFCLLL